MRSATPTLIVAQACAANGQWARCNRCAKFVGKVECILTFTITQYDKKFLAAPAENEIGFAQAAGDALDQRAQHVVTGLVAVRVVDLLEVIDVDQQQAECLWRPAQFAQQLLHQRAKACRLAIPVSLSVTAISSSRRW